MGIGDKLRDFIAPEEGDEDEELELSNEEVESLSDYEEPLDDGINSNTNIALFEPRHFDEAEEIARHIKSHKACCINLHRMPSEYRVRAVDFLSGVVFGVDGSIKKLGEDVILCSPKNLKVGGEINVDSVDQY